MTGTGKIGDPYIVDNWEDFVTAVGESGASVEFPEGGGNIDLNNYAPAGISTVNIKCASIKGNGWTISNIYCTGKNAFYLTSNVSITDLNFLDFYLDDQGKQCKFFGSDENRRTYAFSRCSFTGIVTGTNSRNSSIFYYEYVYSELSLSQCAVNVRCNGTAAIISGGGAANDNNFIAFCNMKSDGNSADMLQTADYRNCYFSGHSADTELNIAYGKANYNVFNVDFTASGAFNCKGNTGAVNLINTDLLPPGAVIGTGFVGVTTDQLQNAAYLVSLGFPIGVD